MAYVAASGANGGELYLRELGQREPRLLTDNARLPFFSPDGEWVGFVDDDDDRVLNKVTINGGPAVVIGNLPAPSNPRGATWGSDDNIIFAVTPGGANLVSNDTAIGLWRIPAGGGEAEMLTTPDVDEGEGHHVFPEILPGGLGVLFTIYGMDGSIENSRIAVLNLATGEYEVLVQGGSNPRYSASGHIVYGVAGTLRAVSFNLDQLEVNGTPVPVLDGVVTKASGVANFSVSPDGTLVYVPGFAALDIERTLIAVDHDGNATPLSDQIRSYDNPRVSPDGTRIAVEVTDEGGSHIWIMNVETQIANQLTFEGTNEDPAWTPDSQSVVFGSDRNGPSAIFQQAADGTGEAELLLERENTMVPINVSPAGILAFYEFEGGDRNIWTLALDDLEATEFLVTEANERSPIFSPNGEWLAYVSSESGQDEVYVRPYPPRGNVQRRVSDGGGFGAIWSPDGREIYYVDRNGTLMSVPIQQTVPSFVAGRPRGLFSAGGLFIASLNVPRYDVHPNDGRFVMVSPRGGGLTVASGAQEINIVLNWFEELKERVPVP